MATFAETNRTGSPGPDSSGRAQRLEQLDRSVAQLVWLIESLENAILPVYDGWSAKDILGHLTFWHESFARNVSDQVAGRAPNPLRGKYAELNRRCMEEMRPLSTAQIVERLRNAHALIRENILSESLDMIPYRKGSRDYTPDEHLEIVVEHIQKHIQDIQKTLLTP